MSHPANLIRSSSPLAGAAMVNGINDWLTALKSSWQGASAPPNPVEGQLWLDTGASAYGTRLRVRIDGLWRVLTSDIGPVVQDFDDEITDGFRRWSSGALNAPAAGNGSLIVAARANAVTQIAFVQSSAEADLISIRVSLNAEGTSWKPWRRVFTQRDIVGDVSMAGGVPGGAIIESGVLSSGEYVRLADGTQKCWGPMTLNRLDVATLGGTWVFPRPFANSIWRGSALLRLVSAAPAVSMLGTLRISASPTPTEMSLELVRIAGMTNFGAGDTATCHVKAVGRWVA
ncbi:pyocin knob domain-containing protein [uncultured Zoogloea sp.]|uniref:pyocin knob domain-containing protein n=1 Tax=uncultured Zoogloea sp. TaxID=160237 RepID=UPI0026201988|nr:pyocin knob domain-containing protein [uncultured Zoogloea sp.]